MSTDHPQFIGVGIYAITEAARLTAVPAARIRRWLRGYYYPTLAGPHQAEPVFHSELPAIEGEMALSFLDLIEVRLVHSLRMQQISWKLIRLAERHAREIYKADHPFATRRFKTDGRRIFGDLKKEHDEQALIDLADKQLIFRNVVEPHLKNLDFDENQMAARWWPMGSQHRVLLDPKRNFGQPIVREGVPTAILARAFKQEDSVESVAKWYEVEVRAVRDAIEFERRIAA